MPRFDITDKLTHFTGPKDDPEGAYQRLVSILDRGAINGGVGMIRGGYRCVCFTEAPVDALPGGPREPVRLLQVRPIRNYGR